MTIITEKTIYVETMDVAKDITVENIMNKVTELFFFSFAKIGIFTFGGGYAMISVIENCCVDKKKWITHNEMMDIAVIAESTPKVCRSFTIYVE